MEAKFQTSLVVISVIPVKVHRQNRVLNQNTMILNFRVLDQNLRYGLDLILAYLNGIFNDYISGLYRLKYSFSDLLGTF